MEILGLPLHPLIVHATVVIVPLAAIGAIAMSLIRWVRVRYGELVLLAAIGAPILTFITQQAGEDLSKRFTQPSPALQEHEALGSTLIWWTIGLLVAVVLVYLGQRLIDRENARGRLVLTIGTVLSLVFGIVTVVQCVRIGHAGATAVWAVG
ncbi:DUF2231 domain-containing protein [Microlunatus ginsengisoli]|uniref:DUF2231 domain-containing protein n=1 Tax=Microlunatus ginsengisoli TaxID=363863 RepID=A0ABP6ZHW8_9ACTN